MVADFLDLHSSIVHIQIHKIPLGSLCNRKMSFSFNFATMDCYRFILISILVAFLRLTLSYQMIDEVQQEQINILMEFKKQIYKDPHEILSTWDIRKQHFCYWSGVTCNKELTQVSAIIIRGMNLNGDLPECLSKFSSSLKFLDLSRNLLNGNISSEFGKLKKLEFLSFSENLLEGEIPPSLANLSSLRVLKLDKNEFEGQIPPSFGSMNKLESIDLSWNRITGMLPAFMANMTSLVEINLEMNSLEGPIPWEWGRRLKDLKLLILNYNELNGEIPASVGNFSSLSTFAALWNMLSGSIPIEIGRLQNLEILWLDVNRFTSHDKMNPVFTALANCPSLRELIISKNRLSGILPDSIGNLSKKLTHFAVDDNFFVGNIPPQIGHLTGLNRLNLRNNSFDGSIPATIGGLLKLEKLDFTSNKLEGGIPTEVGNLVSLISVRLGQNNLSGPIPSSFSRLKQLSHLYLDNNKLSGEIPPQLGDLHSLELLDLSYNRLIGEIPKEFWQLDSLLYYVNMSSNMLQGELSSDIGNSPLCAALDFSSNNLTGGIPAQIQNCFGLEYLNLSRNELTGPIPKSFAKLDRLHTLDLSSNHLSGRLPVQKLRNMEKLEYLNLSYNDLEGTVEEKDFNVPNVSVSLQGNFDICGPVKFGADSCLKSYFVYNTLALTIGGLIALASSLVVVIVFWLRPPQKCDSLMLKEEGVLDLDVGKLGQEPISYKEIVLATKCFNEKNLIGRGSVGPVYHGVLSDGQVVAIKVFSPEIENAKNNFALECKILSNIRHSNIVKLISTCSKPHFQGLVFEYMSNGSLDQKLHGSGSGNGYGCELGLKTRLCIAIDVAHALEYLHHDSFIQIVHCDIKPENILLDDVMSCHIKDFGSVHVINDTSNNFQRPASLPGTKGYIAPEYGSHGKISPECDVYSYGILLLEMLTGKRPNDDTFPAGESLRSWVHTSFPDMVSEITDGSLLQDIERTGTDQRKAFEYLACLYDLGLFCSSELPEVRPNMRNVSRTLENLRERFFGD